MTTTQDQPGQLLRDDSAATAGFQAAYPQYAATARLDHLRKTEYAYLDEEPGGAYLDYTGAGIPSRSQIQQHAERAATRCYGNPHSGSPASAASTRLIEQARRAVLRHFRASPHEYAVIFTPNATGACRLVGEAFPFGPGADLVLTADNHNSVLGIREFARRQGASVAYAPITTADLRVGENAVRDTLGRRPRRRPGQGGTRRTSPGLFAYPAQSNFSGVQHPLTWIDVAHEHGYLVLLDAAAYVPSNELDLSRNRADFVAVSWYKVFGFPTGVGCLIARRSALAELERPWFAGGAVLAASAGGGWHMPAAGESRWEDGTVAFGLIPDIEAGLSWINDIGIALIHDRVMCLTGWLLQQLGMLRHSSGEPMTRIYGPPGLAARGGTVAFNFLDPAGDVVDERVVEAAAAAAGISLRAGCFCNPGAGEAAFGLAKAKLIAAGRLESQATDDYIAAAGLPSGGAIRVSFGLASALTDLERFLRFARETFRDQFHDTRSLPPRQHC